MQIINRALLIYISKCLTGCVVIFILSWLFNYPDVTWCFISVMLVLTPESHEALSLAVIRIKANLIAGASSLLCLLSGYNNLATLCVAIVLTILLCNKFKVMAGSRSAIAAVIIIMLHGLENTEPFFWSATIQRVVAVVTGCLIGLLITLAFHRRLSKQEVEKGNSEEA